MSKQSVRPALSNDREALAAAITAATQAERELQAARDAAQAAMHKQWEAQDRLETLKASEKEPGEDVGAVFAASLTAGEPCDAAVLERPAMEKRDAEAKAERDIEVWTRTRVSCVAAIPAKQAAVDRAKRAVDAAAAHVIQNSDTVSSLLTGLAEMQEQVFGRRLALHFLASKNLVPEAERDRVAAALDETRLPGRPHEPYFIWWHSCRPYAAWAEALAALMHDAEALLPKIGTAE